MRGAVVNLEVDGPEFFCPDCRRWLARANSEEGTFTVAPKATVSLIAEVPTDLPSGEITDAPTLMAEATCNRRLCRLKRWLRR